MAMRLVCDICKKEMLEGFTGMSVTHSYYTVNIVVSATYSGSGDRDKPTKADVCKSCVTKLILGQDPVDTWARSGGSGVKFAPNHETEELQTGWR